MLRHACIALGLFLAVSGGTAAAQTAAEARALAAMSDDALAKMPAKQAFGSHKEPTRSMKARAIGSYAKGCMAGGVAIPVDGPAW